MTAIGEVLTKQLKTDQRRKRVRNPIIEFTRQIEEEAAQSNTWTRVEGRTPNALRSALRDRALGMPLYATLGNVMRDMRAEFKYLAPVRAYPSRHYESDTLGDDLDPVGENCVRTLYQWKKHFPKRFRDVIQAIQLLRLVSAVSLRASEDEILRMHVQPFSHREHVNLADVGFGISQVLPVIVADHDLPKDGTLLVNQPEVHLHPSSQASLADYFVRRLKQRRYVIETHSEYLINRLRLLVSSGQLSPKDVGLFYFSTARTSGEARVHRIIIGKDGALMHAPREFFDTYAMDTFKLAMRGFDGEKKKQRAA